MLPSAQRHYDTVNVERETMEMLQACVVKQDSNASGSVARMLEFWSTVSSELGAQLGCSQYYCVGITFKFTSPLHATEATTPQLAYTQGVTFSMTRSASLARKLLVVSFVDHAFECW